MLLLATILLLGVTSSSHAASSVEDNASLHLNCLASIANLMAEDAHTNDKPDHVEHEGNPTVQEVAELKASLVALEKRLEIMDNVSAIEGPLEVIHNMSAMEERLASNLMTKMGQIVSNLMTKMDQIEYDTSAAMATHAQNVSARLDQMVMKSDMSAELATHSQNVSARLDQMVVKSDMSAELATHAHNVSARLDQMVMKSDMSAELATHAQNVSARLDQMVMKSDMSAELATHARNVSARFDQMMMKSDMSAELATHAHNVSARLDQMEFHMVFNVSVLRERLVDDFTANMSSLEARLRSDFATELSTIQMRINTLANTTTVVNSNHFTDISAIMEQMELDFLTNISAVRNLIEADFMINMTIIETQLRSDLMSHTSTLVEENEYVCNSSISALREEIEFNIQRNISALTEDLESNLRYITNVSAMRQALESEHRRDGAAINQRLDGLKEEVTANMSSHDVWMALHLLQPEDCSGVYHSPYYSINQTYTIHPNVGTSMRVVCQDEWTVIQNRVDGSVDFNQNWNSYKHGFGTVGVRSNFWLGLENIGTITRGGSYTLRVLIKNWEGEERHADYAGFYLENEADLYTLRYSRFIGGTAGDGLGESDYTRNVPFSTYDRDNDGSSGNCAAVEEGGWWYKSCDLANLNGKYHPDHTLSEGIEWDAWQGDYSFKETTMMVKSSG